MNITAESIINESEINDLFELMYSIIISNKQKLFGKGSGWILDSVIDRNVNGSSWSILVKELDHPRRGLINIQNIYDKECFK